MEEKDHEMRKGPWTEQEDVQLVFYVNLFGDRRWDFVAKVSGLKRTGKSCRLRWVNYLHPGLKKGKMTPHEERLVLQLHSKYGNRWSRIAQKLPGRTDNEIKNYWRTYMRKKAQESKKAAAAMSSPSSSSSISSTSSTYNSPSMEFNLPVETTDTRKLDTHAAAPGEKKTCSEVQESTKFYSLDEIWKDIESSQEILNPTYQEMAFPTWDSYTDHSLWFMDEEESTKFPLINHMIGYQKSS